MIAGRRRYQTAVEGATAGRKSTWYGGLYGTQDVAAVLRPTLSYVTEYTQ